MPAVNDTLRKNLDSLKAALGEAEAIDAHTLAEIRETLEEIDRHLAEASKAPPPEAAASTAERLTTGAYRLEASHPDLALALHQIAEALSRLGI